jgi:hypothetical protein
MRFLSAVGIKLQKANTRSRYIPMKNRNTRTDSPQILKRSKRTDNVGLQYEIVISSEVKRNEKSHHL